MIKGAIPLTGGGAYRGNSCRELTWTALARTRLEVGGRRET